MEISYLQYIENPETKKRKNGDNIQHLARPGDVSTHSKMQLHGAITPTPAVLQRATPLKLWAQVGSRMHITHHT
jgi:hypothetical protein